MKKFLCLFFISFVAAANCGPGLSPIRDGAKINYLDLGGYLVFKKNILLPNFDNHTLVAKNIGVKYHPSKDDQRILAGTTARIELINEYESGKEIILEHSFPLFIYGHIESVGDLLKQNEQLFAICKKI